jgi:hypothetical protein
VLKQPLDRCEAGAAGNQHHRVGRRFAQRELAERALDLQHLALAHATEDVLGEVAAGDEAHVQLERAIVVWRVGERVGAVPALAGDHLDVLPGHELHPPVARQLQLQAHDVVVEPLEPPDAHREPLGTQLAGLVDLVDLDHQVLRRARLAEQCETRLRLASLDTIRRLARVGHLPIQQACLAGATGAVAAAVGQYQALAQGRIEQALVGRGLEAMTARLDPDGVGHGAYLGLDEASL